ncbi:HIT family protein [Thermoleophilia bacterium SCSIO 60948]|nr:HIT family protein [Thermoleophilia bacterium SCSIO 60948]
MGCVFCDIVSGEVEAEIVFADEHSVGFLDLRPLFEGHVLLVPREHHEALWDLPSELVEPFFANVRSLSVWVREAMEAKGTFVAMNNIVSQSVPHLHAHVVPRNPKDGLRGFFWPRTKYADAERMGEVGELIRSRIARG